MLGNRNEMEQGIKLAEEAMEIRELMRSGDVLEYPQNLSRFIYAAEQAIPELVRIVQDIIHENSLQKLKKLPVRKQIKITSDFDTPDFILSDFNIPVKVDPDHSKNSISFVIKDQTGNVVSVMTFTNVSIETIGHP